MRLPHATAHERPAGATAEAVEELLKALRLLNPARRITVDPLQQVAPCTLARAEVVLAALPDQPRRLGSVTAVLHHPGVLQQPLHRWPGACTVPQASLDKVLRTVRQRRLHPNTPHSITGLSHGVRQLYCLLHSASECSAINPT